MKLAGTRVRANAFASPTRVLRPLLAAALLVVLPAIDPVGATTSSWFASSGQFPDQVSPPWTLSDSAVPEDPVLSGGVLAIETSAGSSPIVLWGEASSLASGKSQWEFFQHNGSAAESAVPEPGTLLLLDSGVAGLAAWRRRRRKSRTLSVERERRACTLTMLVIAALMGPSPAEAFTVWVSENGAGRVSRLDDRNLDRDFLDTGERLTHASSLTDVWGMAIGQDRQTLFAAERSADRIRRLRDGNGDLDALDFGEALLYATFPAGANPSKMVVRPDGLMYAAGIGNGQIYRVLDTNSDGDALDFAEVLNVATGLSAPFGLALRTDQALFVAETTGARVTRLVDVTGDGDFFDLGEKLVVATGLSGPTGLAFDGSGSLFVTENTAGAIRKLVDLTGDGDFLDAGESVVYATGLTDPYGLAALGSNGDLLVVERSAGRLTRVKDVNLDADALDAGEVMVVAEGLSAPIDVVIPEPATWLLLGSGLAGLAALRRRRGRARRRLPGPHGSRRESS